MGEIYVLYSLHFCNCTNVYIPVFLLSSLGVHYALKAITSVDGLVEFVSTRAPAEQAVNSWDESVQY